MKSILHEKKDRTCFLCMWLHGDDSYKEVLHEHHVIFGLANRRLSERHGLKVYLCYVCHRDNKLGVHGCNTELRERLQQAGQQAFENKIGSREEFMKIFGKNYL